MDNKYKIPMPRLVRQTNKDIYAHLYKKEDIFNDKIFNNDINEEIFEIDYQPNYSKIMEYVKKDIIGKNDIINTEFYIKWGINGIVNAYMDYHNILRYEDSGGSSQPKRNDIPKNIIEYIKDEWKIE